MPWPRTHAIGPRLQGMDYGQGAGAAWPPDKQGASTQTAPVPQNHPTAPGSGHAKASFAPSGSSHAKKTRSTPSIRLKVPRVGSRNGPADPVRPSRKRHPSTPARPGPAGTEFAAAGIHHAAQNGRYLAAGGPEGPPPSDAIRPWRGSYTPSRTLRRPPSSPSARPDHPRGAGRLPIIGRFVHVDPISLHGA